jgi:signal transduction histidine kinase
MAETGRPSARRAGSAEAGADGADRSAVARGAGAPDARGRLAGLRRLGRGGWRPTAHLLAGLPAGFAVTAVQALIVIVWVSAIYASLTDFTDSGELIVLYVLFTFAAPVPLLVTVREAAVLQRARFQAVLGVEIPAPERTPGFWLRPWLVVTTWRHFGYHLLAPAFSVVAVAAAGLCWLALPLAVACWIAGPPALAIALTVAAPPLLLVAPRIAAALAQADAELGRFLLGRGAVDVMSERLESLTRSRAEAVAAADAERRRIERDLHDGAQQRLVSLAMHLGMARAELGKDTPPALRDVIERAHDEALAALTELRELVRGLHPAVLNDRGLDAALSGVVARAPLPVRLYVDVPERCSPRIEAIAYFVVSEALTNITKHAQATGAVVQVLGVRGRLVVEVRDDGRGGATIKDAALGSGLSGLAQRAAAVDGDFYLDSPVGGPTRIVVELPCES